MATLNKQALTILESKMKRTSSTMDSEDVNRHVEHMAIERNRQLIELDLIAGIVRVNNLILGSKSYPLKVNTKMYPTINLGGFYIGLHRLVWMLLHGEIPAGMIVDHKDRDKGNSFPDNLRLATRSENAQNTTTRIDNKLGVKGVSFDPPTNKYRAEITVNKKTIRLGRFSKFEDAVQARKNAEEKYHPHRVR